MFLTIISTLAPVFGVIFLGFFIARLGVMPMSAASGLNLFVYWISLPAMMFNLLVRLDKDMLGGGFLAGFFAALALSYLLCFLLVSDFCRGGKTRAIMFSCMAGFPNVVFMGVPMVMFLLPGDETAQAIAGLCALLYTLVLIGTDTVLEMQCHRGEKLSKYLRSLLKAVLFSPMILACAAGFAFSGLNWPVPEVIWNITGMLGVTAAPCALFAMGMLMTSQVSAAEHRAPGNLADQLTVHLIKLLLLPGLTFAFLWLFGIRGVELAAATLFAGMPIAAANLALAEKFQICVRESSLIIPINTVAGIVTIPGLIVLLYLVGALQ